MVATQGALAQAQTPKAALERLLTSESLDEAWFNDEFLTQIPLTQIEALLAETSQELGSLQRIEGEASPFTVVYAGGMMSAEITLDAEGRIVGLLFSPVAQTVDEAIAAFAALPGEVSVLVLADGEELAALNPGAPLAVGSAFKLAVLAALQEQVAAGVHTWAEIVELQPVWKGLPFSLLKEWPDGSPLTLHTLATLMISMSDNTAADALIDIVGREAVEAYTERNRPLLTTTEAFKLKASPNAALLKRYLNGSETEKRKVLAALARRPLPTLEEMPATPTPAAEWHFTARELCDLMAEVEDLPLMSVEPGPSVSNPQDWAHIAFKGGSELGVLNFTTWLKSKDGVSYCVVATINRTDAAVDGEQFSALYRALVGVVAVGASQ
jgi:beta-lactamase class A